LTLVNPVRHFLEIVRAVFLKGSGILDLWPQYVALTLLAAAVLWLAIVRFGKKMAS
jgi:ABC-2 type transport system permease protein